MAIDVPVIIPFVLAAGLMLWGVVSAVIAFSGNYDNAGIPKIYSSTKRITEMPEDPVDVNANSKQKSQSENPIVIGTLHAGGLGVMGMLVLMLIASLIW
jgi:hypothetical protein